MGVKHVLQLDKGVCLQIYKLMPWSIRCLESDTFYPWKLSERSWESEIMAANQILM